MEARTYHTPVLLQEVLFYLLTARNGFYVDGTLGGGGHAEAILRQLESSGKLMGIDLDDDALAAAGKQLARDSDRVLLVKENFRNIKFVLSQNGVMSVQGILLDLGVSSFQLDEPAKGFSFQADEPLDMRMDRRQELDARHIVNRYDEQALVDLLWTYGEEKHSRRIAKAIVRQRAEEPIETTGALAVLIERTVGKQFLNKSLARVFQAIRIEVNNEMENLRQALSDCVDVLQPGGRLVVISYHSLEDRMVKYAFRAASALSIPSGNKIIPDTPLKPVLKMLTRKPVTASEREREINPRSRSAKLRAAEKV
ncbi:MAG: 16S rRNA (cytosine(1402)-N(4))-methyltransferase RsmH [Ignavibacteriae bacterium]|nr:MAG: 16S rRNA (cytosine(1402)-N(4))-methyltransferase RsmH [Ignavibacteriota bacterium]